MTEWSYSTEQAGFVYTALEDIPRNQEIFTSYGEQDSMQLFLHYGFVSPKTNLVRLKFQLDESMPIHRFKTYLLNNYASRFFNCEADLKKPDMQQLLCWCRLCTFAGDAKVFFFFLALAVARRVQIPFFNTFRGFGVVGIDIEQMQA